MTAQEPQGLSTLSQRLEALDNHLRSLKSVLIAFSGGADSAFLLAAAVRSLGPTQVAAGTAVSPSLPATELDAARAYADGLGVAHHTPRTDELSRPNYAANGPDRCFHCKAELLDVLTPLARALDLAHVATGTNADDARDGFRPGIRAAFLAGAETPLKDAHLSKADVRAASKEWGLVTADKPAAACLASRVAYGLQISPARLNRIEEAERELRAALTAAGMDVRDLRVRDYGDRAVIEVDRDFVEVLSRRTDLLNAVQGFDTVDIDPRGFRSGSMNDVHHLRQS